MWDEENRDLQVKLLLFPSLVSFLPALTEQWKSWKCVGSAQWHTLVLLRLFAVTVCYYSCYLLIISSYWCAPPASPNKIQTHTDFMISSRIQTLFHA